MKTMVVFTLAVFAVVSCETYTTENDNLDIEAIVNDPKQLKTFSDCFNKDIGCNDLLNSLKKDMPEAIQQGCAKCTPAQEHILWTYIVGLKKNMPEDYQAYRAKYDPENKYFDALEAKIANA